MPQCLFRNDIFVCPGNQEDLESIELMDTLICSDEILYIATLILLGKMKNVLT